MLELFTARTFYYGLGGHRAFPYGDETYDSWHTRG